MVALHSCPTEGGTHEILGVVNVVLPPDDPYQRAAVRRVVSLRRVPMSVSDDGGRGADAVCPGCGASMPAERGICARCAQALVQAVRAEPLPQAAPSPPPVSAPVPWYFRQNALALAFLIFIPLWTLLILMDKRPGRASAS